MSIVATILAADSVVYDLASRYCPVDRSVFLSRLGTLVAAFIGIALLLAAFGRFGAHDTRRKELAYIAACAIAVFAIGNGALVIFGLSGCGGGTEAGLIWEWPW